MLRSLTRRRTLPVALVAVAAVALTGCGGSDTPKKAGATATATPTPAAAVAPCAVTSGPISDSVSVTGAFGQKNPKVTFTAGLKAKSLQRTILQPGTGATTKTGEILKVYVTGYNGRTGLPISSETDNLTAGNTTFPASLDAGFDCVPLHSRVVTTFPASDIYGAAGNPTLKVLAGDSLVVITDVVAIAPPPAPPKALVPGLWTNAPKVSFKAGVPSFKLVGPPEPKLLLHVITPGTGVKIATTDTVSVRYYGYSWEKKAVFDQNFGAGKSPASFQVSGVVKGFAAAIAGQRVGAHVIVTMPAVDAYGPGTATATGPPVGQTLVFYIEIVSAKAA
jgi:FKBP-type peptidyl-prolyl cis-trans isomerase